MTVVIEDEQAVAEVKRLAEGLSLAPEEVVRRAILEKAGRELKPPRSSPEEMRAAIRELQDWYEARRDPNDHRTPDEIIGYNEHGLFD